MATLGRRRWLLTLAALLSAVAIGLPAGALAAGGPPPPLPTADPFYSYSGSLTSVAPGTVLRARTITVHISSLATPFRATQVLYRTTGEMGQPTVTVASIVRPLLQLGRPKLVSYQMAYDALGPQCDVSYTLQGGNPGDEDNDGETTLMAGYLAAGDTVVASDYEGTSLDWGAGQESGAGTLDGIRAAEQLLRLSSATPVGLVGYSGGAIATDFAAEMAPTYAPDLRLVGTAEGGIPVDFAHNLAYVNGSTDWSGTIPAILVSLGRAFHIDLTPYLSPYGQAVTNEVQNECITNFLGSYPGLTIQQLMGPKYQDFLAIPTFRDVINHLIMGGTGTPTEPMLLVAGNADGTGDGVMVAADEQTLAYTYCQRGVPVEFNAYKGLSHVAAAIPFELQALLFLNERLAGLPVANGCHSIGPGDSIAPLS